MGMEGEVWEEVIGGVGMGWEYGGEIRVVLGITFVEGDISDWVGVGEGWREEVGERIEVVLKV